MVAWLQMMTADVEQKEAIAEVRLAEHLHLAGELRAVQSASQTAPDLDMAGAGHDLDADLIEARIGVDFGQAAPAFNAKRCATVGPRLANDLEIHSVVLKKSAPGLT